MGPVEYLSLHGRGAIPFLDQLAELRMKVFREYPYLYDGNADYERRYLQTYVASSDSLVVLARLAGQIIGASTCVPLSFEEESFRRPFEERGIPAAEVMYFGESVILPGYRGHGIGKTFFSLREAHARALRKRYAVFCAVARDPNDPRRPPSYRSPERLWVSEYYRPLPGFTTTYRWKQIDEAEESEKRMEFWMKDLSADATRAVELVKTYFAAFNRQDNAGMLKLLAANVEHESNQGATQVGTAHFEEFLKTMHQHYREEIKDLKVLTQPEGRLAAAEYIVDGAYIKTQAPFPAAQGQRYAIRAHSFFAIEDGLITRVSTHYNLPEWIRKIEG